MPVPQYDARAERCLQLAKRAKQRATRAQLENVAEIWRWISRRGSVDRARVKLRRRSPRSFLQRSE
jgi:hypothetical protein